MSVADKLQIKPGQRVVVLGLPEDVDLGVVSAPAGDAVGADAVVVFVRAAADLDGPAAAVALDAARRDALAWVAYPKAGQLGTDLNRDSLAGRLGERGTRAVRQVAIDDVWSALRFRPGR